ncbi:alpha/beta hydrolase [Flavobacterium aciduliphilum]|uniref:Pimeloyl-ACP methyl ester carboxylesterase n=1 Tax=Flavobacterium aciduliphilum TaxID=1101402 RepID=A0A328YQU2_9FLAO|nr:alpha/beta hydrolase [Flavobacterium aciduliphilum]RAR75734.1 hypothetical protein CLV55_101438 [Flavobacterium aciduliphilum]
MKKIPVYFMPGLAASPTIFERIHLPESVFEMHFLEWRVPDKNDTLQDYAQRMVKQILHENPILVGVSFGGILIQEMARFITCQKIIIISSVKSNQEFPVFFKIANNLKLYKLLPMSLFTWFEILLKRNPSKKGKKRWQLYDTFLNVRDQTYLKWSITQILTWTKATPDEHVIHIHGDKDAIFPIKKIQHCIVVSGGTHIMIVTQYRWFNEHLPKIILEQ